jgi:2-hydroxy-3-keto-5-methylthiopentenyl-1-phosphate phosphatase
VSARRQLVVDWDGTVTEHDTLHMVMERFGDLDVFRALEADIERGRPLNEVISVELATVTASFDEVKDWLLEHVVVRPGLAELVAAHDPLIVSAGFHELIEPVLAREGVSPRVVANHVEADPAGWRSRFRVRPTCDVCGEPCKRMVLAGSGSFAYVGDGVSDRCVSLAADRVFARAGLARWLDERGVGYEPYVDLHDVRLALASREQDVERGTLS